MKSLVLIEFRFIVEKEPKDKYEALALLKQELQENQCAEEYIRWTDWKDDV